MNFHMAAVRTTLVLERQRLIELKRLAASQRRTLSSLVDGLLRQGLAHQKSAGRRGQTLELPSFDMGQPAVNLADRDRLMDLMGR